MKKDTIELIEAALKKAREKHPQFITEGHKKVGASFHVALSILMEEVGEVAKAVNENNFYEAIQEVGDIMAVCIRIIEDM